MEARRVEMVSLWGFMSEEMEEERVGSARVRTLERREMLGGGDEDVVVAFRTVGERRFCTSE